LFVEKPAMTCVAIVIVNYKTPQLVTECLASLVGEQSADMRLKVYVGDADSGDGSTAIISRYIAENNLDFAQCFDIGGNYGFAYGNNYIVHHHVLGDLDVDYIHFLNPDTYVHPGAVAALVDVLRKHPRAGVAGSRLENPDGSLRSYGFRFYAPWREFFRGARLPMQARLLPASEIKVHDLLETQQVDWVTGASFMVTREIVDRIGLMDPRYFLYFEEVEYMSRIRNAGFEIWHVAQSRVVHIQGSATGVKASEAPRRLPAYWYESRFKFFCDRYGQARAVLANMSFLLGDAVYRIHRALRFKAPENPPFLWQDMFAHGFRLPTAKGPPL
jgi:N-acetylglucosaminyl-diphospho-decaprenol L-rhamnosyltransferase